MFARIKKSKNSDGKIREYLLIVKNERVRGRVVQRTVANLVDTEKACFKKMFFENKHLDCHKTRFVTRAKKLLRAF